MIFKSNQCDLEHYIRPYRIFDPTVNILAAPWHPLEPVSFSMPLLADLSNWREKLADMEQEIYDNSNYSEVIFVADFPGKE